MVVNLRRRGSGQRRHRTVRLFWQSMKRGMRGATNVFDRLLQLFPGIYFLWIVRNNWTRHHFESRSFRETKPSPLCVYMQNVMKGFKCMTAAAVQGRKHVQQQESMVQHPTYNQHLMEFLQQQLDKVQNLEAPWDATEESRKCLQLALKRGRKLIGSHCRPFSPRNFYKVDDARKCVQQLCDVMVETIQGWGVDPAVVIASPVPEAIVEVDKKYLYCYLRYIFHYTNSTVDPFHDFWDDIRIEHESQIGRLRVFSGQEFTNQQEISVGGMSRIYSANWEMHPKKVAIKKLLLSDRGLTLEEFADFFREASVLEFIVHPQIVIQYGITRAGWIIMELADADLRTVCYHNLDLCWSTKLRLLQQAANGLKEMHNRNLIHHDVKTSNCLVFGARNSAKGEWLLDNCAVKIADFGLTIEAEGTRTTTMRTAGGSREYIAPEADSRERMTLKSDVFSFGVVMFEVVSGFHPYGHQVTAYGLMGKKQGEKDPCTIFEHRCPPQMLELMRKCIVVDVDARPTMEEITRSLGSMPK